MTALRQQLVNCAHGLVVAVYYASYVSHVHSLLYQDSNVHHHGRIISIAKIIRGDLIFVVFAVVL